MYALFTNLWDMLSTGRPRRTRALASAVLHRALDAFAC